MLFRSAIGFRGTKEKQFDLTPYLGILEAFANLGGTVSMEEGTNFKDQFVRWLRGSPQRSEKFYLYMICASDCGLLTRRVRCILTNFAMPKFNHRRVDVVGTSARSTDTPSSSNSADGATFPYYGGKRSLATKYPPAEHGIIVELFAGSAAYSMHHATPDTRVILCELNPKIYDVWKLLQVASEADVLALPILQKGASLDDYTPPLTETQKTVISPFS